MCALPAPYEEMHMLNIQAIINAIELSIEIQELKELGLSNEEIDGFIETFCESWIIEDNGLILN